MPQLNPMNWLVLMLFFLLINYVIMVKISFFTKDFSITFFSKNILAHENSSLKI